MPSMKAFEKHIKEKEERIGKKILDINFRDKESGWHKYSIKYKYEDNTEEYIKASEDIFMKGFLKDYYLRESCYNCNFKIENKNTSDIILGDFWGIEKVNKDLDDDKGTSVIIINSKKGKELINNLEEDKLEIVRCNYEDVKKYNSSIEFPAKYKKQRYTFFNEIENNKLDSLVIDYIETEKEEKNK
jgi:coenzyme F420-reducing hydrogenase beta subunit